MDEAQKNRNLTTGVNISSTTLADVKESPASLETDFGNTQSGVDEENQKEVQSQLSPTKTSNNTQSFVMGNKIDQAENGTETNKKCCFFALWFGSCSC